MNFPKIKVSPQFFVKKVCCYNQTIEQKTNKRIAPLKSLQGVSTKIQIIRVYLIFFQFLLSYSRKASMIFIREFFIYIIFYNHLLLFFTLLWSLLVSKYVVVLLTTQLSFSSLVDPDRVESLHTSRFDQVSIHPYFYFLRHKNMGTVNPST